MKADPSSSSSAQPRSSVVALWRYPVKSMMGEELNATEITDRGLVGDRQFAVLDVATGKVAGAKNPRKWGNFFDFPSGLRRAAQAWTESPRRPVDVAERGRRDQ
jgi:uncharacterized protein